MSVEVVIPWAGGCSHREEALGWLNARLGSFYRTLAQYNRDPWSKAKAITPAVEVSSADIIVMHDADAWCHGLEWAIEQVKDGAVWASPHDRVNRLTPASTRAVLDGADPEGLELIETHRAVWGGGIVVLPRETYLSCPLDPRFVGWGQEDISWANALWFLAGEGVRASADLIHLWHPPQNRLTRDRGSAENVALAARYRQARFKPGAMRELVNEFRRTDADRPAEQALSDHSAVLG